MDKVEMMMHIQGMPFPRPFAVRAMAEVMVPQGFQGSYEHDIHGMILLIQQYWGYLSNSYRTPTIGERRMILTARKTMT